MIWISIISLLGNMQRIFQIKTFILVIFLSITLSLCAQGVENFVIKDIGLDDSSSAFIINGNSPSQNLIINTGLLSNPDRAFMDVHGCLFPGKTFNIEPKGIGITSIRTAQFDNNPNIVRIVFTAKTPQDLKNIKVIKYHNSVIFRLKKLTPTLKNKNVVYKDQNLATSDDEPVSKIVKVITEEEKIKDSQESLEQKKEEKAVEFELEESPEAQEETVQETQDVSSREADEDPKIKDFLTKSNYVITKINADKTKLKISGVGFLSLKKPFILDEPKRIVFDLPESLALSKDLLQSFELQDVDKVKTGRFENKTVRIVINSPEAEKYKSVLSPDAQSLIIAKEDNIEVSEFSDSENLAKVEKVVVKQVNNRKTNVQIVSSTPIIHNVRRYYDRLIFEFYNLEKPDDKTISEIKTTRQFEGFEIEESEQDKNLTKWSLALKKTSKVETKISLDGKTIDLNITGGLVPVVNVVIGKNRKVVLDAGHGGYDTGASRAGINEKDIVLDITKRVHKYLTDAGVHVIMTRYNDSTVSLKKRVEIANNKKPDAFVSIHVNSSRKPYIRGLETHWYGGRGLKLARVMHRYLASSINSPDRGLFKSRFYVIYRTSAPAVLIETGFISNQKERYQLITNERKEDTARAISNGILMYLSKTRRR